MFSLNLCVWVGKVAVVTGVSEGSIGSGIAQKLVEEGLLVVGISRRSRLSEEYLKKVSGKKGVFYARKADITNEQSVLDTFKWISSNLGPISVLVNAAGVARKSSLVAGDSKDWKNIFDTHVLGLSIVTREAIKIMRENKIHGQIVHINSIFGHKVPNLSTVHVHPASKFAVTALTETLRQELNTINSKIKITVSFSLLLKMF